MFRQEVAVGRAVAGEAAAGADQLDLEAAEQLIQLSGGDGGSETRSADSVKCCGADQDQAGVKEKEVESRRRSSVARKDGHDGGEAAGGPDGRRSAHGIVTECPMVASKEEPAAESRMRRSSAARLLAGKDAAGGVVDHGEERRRPRFRWVADIYRETRRLTARDPHAAGGNVPMEAEGRRKRKRAADSDEEVLVSVAV